MGTGLDEPAFVTPATGPLAVRAAADGHRQKPGARGLADAARPREEVGVPEPPAPDGGRQYVRDVVLPDHGAECAWSGTLRYCRHQQESYHLPPRSAGPR